MHTSITIYSAHRINILASVNTYPSIPNSATSCDVYQHKQVTLIHPSSFVCIVPDPWNSVLYTV